MKQPILQDRQDGRTVFVTKYHQRGDEVVSAGERFEFDVTRPVKQIKADTIEGLNEALIDRAYGSGEPNIAQWISTQRHLAAEHHQQPQAHQATAGGRPSRDRAVDPVLETQGDGWMLRLQHRDQNSGYVPSRQPGGFAHPVTEQIATLRSDLIEQHIAKLGQMAWREKRPDAMRFVQDLAVDYRESRTTDYGVYFAIDQATPNRHLRPEGPMLQAIPGGRM
ncbi:MAG: hypothetical protein AAF213_01145 [Pseudomonadota bacterium]